MKRYAWLTLILTTAAMTACSQEPSAMLDACAALSKLTLPDTKNLKAERVEAGKFPAPATWRPSAADAEVYKLNWLCTSCSPISALAPSEWPT